jgi:hypothetical protein
VSRVWVPQDLPRAALDAFVEIEYLKYQIKMAEHKHSYLAAAAQETKRALEALRDNETFLQRDAKIVSMKEFGNIKSMLKRMREAYRLKVGAVNDSEVELKKLRCKLGAREDELAKMTSIKKIIRMDRHVRPR